MPRRSPGRAVEAWQGGPPVAGRASAGQARDSSHVGRSRGCDGSSTWRHHDRGLTGAGAAVSAGRRVAVWIIGAIRQASNSSRAERAARSGGHATSAIAGLPQVAMTRILSIIWAGLRERRLGQPLAATTPSTLRRRTNAIPPELYGVFTLWMKRAAIMALEVTKCTPSVASRGEQERCLPKGGAR